MELPGRRVEECVSLFAMKVRTLAPTLPQTGSPIEISETEANHLVKVLRLGPDAEIAILDGKGGLCLARLEMRGKRQVFAHFVRSLDVGARGLRVPVSVELALLKGDAMDWAVEKLTEIGVSDLYPVLTDFCVVQFKSKGPEEFRARWQRIADQALKQCERVHTLRVHLPRTLQEHWTQSALAADEVRLWANETALDPALEPTVRGAWQRAGCNALRILIGPEGGFSPGEQDWLVRDPGAQSISLGPWILRAETAAIVAGGVAVQSYLGLRV